MVLRSPTVQVESIDNSSYNGEFRLHCRSRTFIFYTESDEDRKYWVKNLDMSIKGTHPEEKHTKEVHNQAKSLINDAAAEVTVYSSKSDDSGDEDRLCDLSILTFTHSFSQSALQRILLPNVILNQRQTYLFQLRLF
eukprot:TRINITY_DN2036_c1_g1_i14.p1 TRINITY_DN2036_c1_g1~~TRINITY_DN2036_c1_g1_i14.p1  ORF type:complete len:137 (+),score=3.75 TRINITY_DN2036_c1_g1_i14:423-833(+)